MNGWYCEVSTLYLPDEFRRKPHIRDFTCSIVRWSFWKNSLPREELFHLRNPIRTHQSNFTNYQQSGWLNIRNVIHRLAIGCHRVEKLFWLDGRVQKLPKIHNTCTSYTTEDTRIYNTWTIFEVLVSAYLYVKFIRKPRHYTADTLEFFSIRIVAGH